MYHWHRAEGCGPRAEGRFRLMRVLVFFYLSGAFDNCAKLYENVPALHTFGLSMYIAAPSHLPAFLAERGHKVKVSSAMHPVPSPQDTPAAGQDVGVLLGCVVVSPPSDKAPKVPPRLCTPADMPQFFGSLRPLVMMHLPDLWHGLGSLRGVARASRLCG